MDDFVNQYKLININSVKSFLESKKKPCYESELLRIAFPEINIVNTRPFILYQKHFLLFHLLYLLQNEYYKKGKYLFVHFMRTFLSEYPKSGLCRFYNEHSGMFCRSSCQPHINCGPDYCDFHKKKMEVYALEELSDKYFYLDKKNFYNLDEDNAEDYINGTWEIMNQYDEYEKSIKILEITGIPDAASVKKKFRELAKKYHPDLGSMSHEKFNEINRAYRLLMRLVIQTKI